MAVIEQTTVDILGPGWFPDPNRLHNLRYFDGNSWTDHVTHFGPTPCSGCSYKDDEASSN